MRLRRFFRPDGWLAKVFQGIIAMHWNFYLPCFILCGDIRGYMTPIFKNKFGIYLRIPTAGQEVIVHSRAAPGIPDGKPCRTVQAGDFMSVKRQGQKYLEDLSSSLR
jgi:hypothetical protein